MKHLGLPALVLAFGIGFYYIASCLACEDFVPFKGAFANGWWVSSRVVVWTTHDDPDPQKIVYKVFTEVRTYHGVKRVTSTNHLGYIDLWVATGPKHLKEAEADAKRITDSVKQVYINDLNTLKR